MYVDLKGELQERGIKRGRDAIFDIARANNLLVKKTKLYHITTDSRHHFYKSPNLIKNILPSRAEQAFAADITYIRIENDWAYLAKNKTALELRGADCAVGVFANRVREQGVFQFGADASTGLGYCTVRLT